MPVDRGHRRRARSLRVIGYVLLLAALTAPIVQFQHGTMKKVRQGKPTHKGAMARWSRAVDGFWEGKDIYSRDANPGMHPNTPFTVILLTPLTSLPAGAMALTMNVAKALAVLACILMLAQLASHGNLRVCDWVLALGVLWAYHSLLSDIQHGNTNIFVLFFIVLHLWLYRRGRDLGAGCALALAICLKMTPALFVLYWVYQRNWRVLIYTFAAGVVCVGLVPIVALGTAQYGHLMGSWLDNMIIPGLVKGAWYPIHINQSMSGYFSRLFLTGAEGDVFFNPDDNPDYSREPINGFITLVSLSPETVKMLLRVGQVAIVGLIAWGIGWRKLPRDDGRRLLHYGLITLGMMLLNQRTWTHHAAVLLIASVGIWQAIAFGLMRRRIRAVALSAMIGVVVITWVTASDAFHAYAKLTGDDDRFGEFTIGAKELTMGELWADFADAYGPQFWVFVIMLGVSVALARALRKGDSPYTLERQTLSAGHTPMSPE